MMRARWPVAPSQGRGSKRFHRQPAALRREVAPSQGRGSKPLPMLIPARNRWSPPHRGADRNFNNYAFSDTGQVAPSQGRGSKQGWPGQLPVGTASPPHRGADRNDRCNCIGVGVVLVAPSQGRGSKHLHGGMPGCRRGRPLTGARREAPQKQKKAGAVDAPAFFKRSLQLHQAAVVGMPFSVKTAWSSWFWNISRTMSQPPRNSPLT